MSKTEIENNKPRYLFPLGETKITQGALDSLAIVRQNPTELLFRHVTGDWGELDEIDKQENDADVSRNLRLQSSYLLKNGAYVWVVTEDDRSQTTIMLPSEY